MLKCNKINNLLTLLKGMSDQEIDTALKTMLITRDEEKSSVYTLESFHSEYEAWAESECSKKYHLSINVAFKHCKEFYGSDKILSEISVCDVENLKAYLIKKAPKGYRVYLRTLKAAFNKALDWDYLKSNPFLKVKINKHQKEMPFFIGPAELDLILQKTQDKTHQDIFLFAFYTGCRLGEVVNLRWQNVDLENKRMLTIGDEHFLTKTRMQRKIPIHTKISQMLKARYSERLIPPLPTDFVFCKNNGFPFTGEYISKVFKKICRSLKIDEHVHFHTLRHSFASNLVQRGVPIYTLKDLLGHTSVKTTEIYAHNDDETLYKAISAFDNAA